MYDTRISTTDFPTWGVLGPSGRVWVFGVQASDGSPIDQRESAEAFAKGTGMELVQRAPGGDWTAVSA